MARLAKTSAPDWIVDEAKKCGNCETQCKNRVGVPFDGMFAHMKKGDVHAAKAILTNHDPLPHLSSHLCYEKSERACPHSIRIKHAISEIATHGSVNQPKSRKQMPAVAIIGAGISGLAMASLAKTKGYEVHLFEAMPQLGGSARYLCPEWRMPRDALQKQISDVSEGIEVYTNAVIGSTVFVEELAREFEAVIVCTGSNRPAFPGIPGEGLHGVHTANDVLLGHDTGPIGSTVVVGHGTPALDAAIIEARAGAYVTVVCSKESMITNKSLLDTARREGVTFMMLTEPVALHANDKGSVKSIELRQLMLGEEDFDGNRVEIQLEDSEFTLDCNKVILATGYDPNPSIGMYSTLRTVGKQKIWTNPHYQTTIDNVFAAGEMVIGHRAPEEILKNVKDVFVKVEQFLGGTLPKEDAMEEEPLN